MPAKATRTLGAASVSGSEIRLNQLHRDCHNRVKYRKICLEHGEVASDEIVSGSEYAKDQYVVIDPQELDALRSESDKAINVDTFVAPEEVDPVHYSG